MNITPVLTQLRTQCPALTVRIAPGLDLESLQALGVSTAPLACLVSLADLAGPALSQNSYGQKISDRFAITLVLPTAADQGQSALDQVHKWRADIWRALVGFKPGPQYDAIEYDGGELLALNDSGLFYRLRFLAAFQLGRNRSSDPAETWHECEQDGLPSFTGMTVRVDAIDPADPNLQQPGPDGRLELTFSGEVTP